MRVDGVRCRCTSCSSRAGGARGMVAARRCCGAARETRRGRTRLAGAAAARCRPGSTMSAGLTPFAVTIAGKDADRGVCGAARTERRRPAGRRPDSHSRQSPARKRPAGRLRRRPASCLRFFCRRRGGWMAGSGIWRGGGRSAAGGRRQEGGRPALPEVGSLARRGPDSYVPPERRRPDSLKWHTAIERRPADRLRQGEGWPVAKGGLWQGEGWLANRDRRRRQAGGG